MSIRVDALELSRTPGSAQQQTIPWGPKMSAITCGHSSSSHSVCARSHELRGEPALELFITATGKIESLLSYAAHFR